MKAYTSYIMLAIYAHKAYLWSDPLLWSLAGWLFRWKPGDPDTVTTVDYFAKKLNKKNCHCFQVMRLSLLEANAEKEKINLKTGSKLTKLLFQYISHTHAEAIYR